MTRYSRQTRLDEVGEPGQARLLRARVEVDATTEIAASVARRYLEGAGVNVTDSGAPGLPASPCPTWIAEMDPVARDVAEGAYRALVAIRTILQVAASGSAG